MENLKIALVQTDIYWENITANLASLEEKFASISADTDLIILPEMFNSGFSMKTEILAEPMNLTTFRWMKQMAEKTGAVVTGSYIVKENGHNYNRLIWMQPDGNYDQYDKRHLFRMAAEHDHYAAGTNRIIKEWKGWKICPLICYDLRFPVWSRNVNAVYDVLIYVANWPAVRSHIWSNLLLSRAIENQCYVVGVNRVGVDGNGYEHSGDSAIANYTGKTLSIESNIETIIYFELNKSDLVNFREKFPAHLDADVFEIKIE